MHIIYRKIVPGGLASLAQLVAMLVPNLAPAKKLFSTPQIFCNPSCYILALGGYGRLLYTLNPTFLCQHVVPTPTSLTLGAHAQRGLRLGLSKLCSLY